MGNPIQDITESFADVATNLAGGAGVLVLIAIIIGGTFLSIVIVIVLRRKFDFEGTGHQLGHYMLILADKYPIEANIAEWDEVDDSDLDLLERSEEKDFEVYADVIRQMRKEGNIFIYTVKITDDSEVEDELGKRTFIISSEDLDDKKTFFESQKAKLTWRSLFQKEKTRIVQTFSPVDIVTVYNEDKNEDDWIFIVPQRNEKPKTNVVGFDSRAITKHSYYITPKPITNAEKLAYGSSYMPYVIRTKREFDQLLQENKALEETVEERSAEVQSKQQVIQRKNRKLGTKEWVITSKTVREKDMQVNMAWVIGAIFVGGVLPKIFGSYIENDTTALFIGIGVAMGFIGLAYKLTYGKKKTEEDEGITVEETK